MPRLGERSDRRTQRCWHMQPGGPLRRFPFLAVTFLPVNFCIPKRCGGDYTDQISDISISLQLAAALRRKIHFIAALIHCRIDLLMHQTSVLHTHTLRLGTRLPEHKPSFDRAD